MLQNNFFRFSTLFIIYFGLLNSIWAAEWGAKEGLDICFSETDGTKNLRILHYNIKKQKLLGAYDLTSDSDEVLEKKLRKLDFSDIDISADGDITLQENFESSQMLIRTTGEIDSTEIDDDQEAYRLFDIRKHQRKYDKRYKHLYRTKKITRAKKVCEFLDSSYNLYSKAAFPVTRFPDTSKVVRTLENIENSYLGIIGETITELTMLSFGYDQLGSKYEDNHGIDGVFIDRSDEPECFITESKCWSKSQAAATTMKNYLSENDIYQRIQTGISKASNIKKSMDFVEDFILDNPKSVFKFAHRTNLSGESQGALSLLDHDEYSRLSGKMTVKALAKELKKLSSGEMSKLKKLIR
jgi:hypothetical protein